MEFKPGSKRVAMWGNWPFTNLSARFGRGTAPVILKAGQVPLEWNLDKRGNMSFKEGGDAGAKMG